MNNKEAKPEFIDFLSSSVSIELPGQEAHKKMAPILEDKIFRSFKKSKSAKPSAVLILLSGNTDDTLSILFTLRSKNINHSGQISFPGGRIEKDESATEAALRETEEEVGIDRKVIRYVAMLSTLYVPPSDSIIQPVVAYIENIPELKLSHDEVEEAFLIPLNKFIDETHFRKEPWNLNGLDIDVPFWDMHHSTPLWGATAMILSELIELFNIYQNRK